MINHVSHLPVLFKPAARPNSEAAGVELLDKLDLGHFEELYPNTTIEEIQTRIHSMWKKRN